jgi:hypothetical protein
MWRTRWKWLVSGWCLRSLEDKLLAEMGCRRHWAYFMNVLRLACAVMQGWTNEFQQEENLLWRKINRFTLLFCYLFIYSFKYKALKRRGQECGLPTSWRSLLVIRGNAHAHNFVGEGDVSLLPILKAFAQITRSLQATRNAWCFQSAYSSRRVCHSYQ